MALPFPTFQAAGTYAEGTGASVTPSYMGSISAGDFLFLLAMNYQSSGAGSISTPSGYSLLSSQPIFRNGSIFEGNANLYYKIATGSESGTETVSRSGTTGAGTTLGAQIYQYRAGVDIILGGGSYNYGYSATISWGNPSGGKKTLLAFVAQRSAVSITTPSGYTQRDNVSSSLRLALYDDDAIPYGAITTSGGDSNGWTTFHVALDIPVGRTQVIEF